MVRTAIRGPEDVPGLNQATGKFEVWQDAVGKDDETWHVNEKSSAGEDVLSNDKLPPPV